jgi:CheY-like chemotaxis protein
MARIQGGALTMHTSDRSGTTLHLALPQATAAQTRALLEGAAGQTEATPVPAQQLPAWRVLAVDDDEYNLLVMRRYLPSPPLQVETAVNGRAAVDAALRQPPDLVFIDLDMPVMDGLQATRRLREHQSAGRLKPFTIVMLSSHDDADTRERARDAGCDLYLTKPVSREELLRTLHWAAGARDGDPESPTTPPAEVPAEVPAHEVELDPDLLDKLPAFLASRRELLATLATAAAENDSANVRRLAHRLAGSFSLYGFHGAAQQCRRIENEAWPAPDVAAACGALQRHLDDVQSRTLAAAADPQ